VLVAAGCRPVASRTTAASAEVPSATVALPAPSASAAAPSASAAAPSASAAAPDRAWRRPFLWRLTPPPKASYLVGTMHLPDPRLRVLPAALERVLVECEAYYGEIPLDAVTQSRLAAALLLPGGSTLGDVLPAELHARVEREWTSRGVPFAPFDRMKPWVVSVQVTLLDRFSLLAQQPPLDAALYARAEADGKEVGGLESVAEQVAVFDGLTAAEQAALLRDTLDQIDRYRRERRDPTEELVAAYVSGEDARVTRLLEEDFDPQDPLDVKVRQRLFTDRNARMADRITACLRAAPPRAYLFAVGAGHVVGADGLVARLERAGWQPRRTTE